MDSDSCIVVAHRLGPDGAMTHNEKRQHWLKEGAIGLGTGVLYGITSVAVGPSIVLPVVSMCARTHA